MADDTTADDATTLKIFVSYAREDLAFVDRLAATLRPRRIASLYDRTSIEKFAVWRERIEQLIGAADTVVFVLSPDSAASESCRRELDFAIGLNKRLAPIVARDVDDLAVPKELQRINYIFFRATDDFSRALDELVVALHIDIEWIREHTRLGEMARRWAASGAPDDQLLRGGDIVKAEQWVARPPRGAPEPTGLHRQFIEASSRRRELRRRTRWQRVSAYDEKIRLLIQRAEFPQAEEELAEAIQYLAEVGDPELSNRQQEFDARRGRVQRLIEFYDLAREVYVRSGEEEFDRARAACERGLAAIGVFENSPWWEHLPVDDLDEPAIVHLKYEAHRQLLLLSALRLQPGIDKITPKTKPSFDVMKVLRFVPAFALKAFAHARGLELVPALRKQDNPPAAADFTSALTALELVRGFESAQAAAQNTTFPPSRTSGLVRQMGELLLTYSSGPRGARIDYHALLARNCTAAPTSPSALLNPADYYFLGLFNFFIAKRRDATIAKLFSLFPGLFPDLDPRAPFETAERLLRTGVSREPDNFWPHFVLGRTLLSREDFRGAELAFNVCISIFPTYARGYEQRALALAGQWRERGHVEVRIRAEDDSRRALQLGADDPSIFWPRGELLESLGDLHLALDAYCRWMELEEDVLGRLSRSTGVKKAHDLATGLLKRRLSPVSRVVQADCRALLGLVHFLWRRPETATEFVTRALQIEPNHPHALTVRGSLRRQRGELAAAITDLDAALRADPTAYFAALERARAYEELAPDERARQAWADLAAPSPVAGALPAWLRKAAADAETRLRRALPSGISAGLPPATLASASSPPASAR